MQHHAILRFQSLCEPLSLSRNGPNESTKELTRKLNEHAAKLESHSNKKEITESILPLLHLQLVQVLSWSRVNCGD